MITTLDWRRPALARLIKDLRAVSMMSALPDDPADRLATFLEHVVALPAEQRRWGLTLTGHEEQDRVAIADWLYQQAHAPLLCAPSWTRGFSEIMGWVLRHDHPVSDDGIRCAIREMRAALKERLRTSAP